MVTRRKILERLEGQVEDSRLWGAIAEVLDDWEELQGLQWLRGEMETHGNSEQAERLKELERRFSIK